MTESERTRFIQRRRNDLYALGTNFLLIGPLLYSIPVLVLLILVAACIWAISLFTGDRAWSVFMPAATIIVALGILVYVTIYWNVISFGIDRAKLPHDAVIRIVEIGSDELRRTIIGYTPNDKRYTDSASIVLLDFPDIGETILPIIDPDEGELRYSDDGALRIAWSPLRKYLVEWIEVPQDWPGSLKPITHDAQKRRNSLTHIPCLTEMYARLQNEKPPAHAGGSSDSNF